MKTFVRYAVVVLAALAACQAGLASAESYYWASGGTDEKATAAAPSGCATCDPGACDPTCDPTCGGSSCTEGMGCDPCPCGGIVGFAGLDSFKGISDASYPSNFGAVSGLNAAMPALGLADYGIGWQLGMSYGVYDFDGRGQLGATQARSQQQVFVTTGFYRKADEDQRVSFGLVYDWMVNDQWGVYGTTPTLGQWRGQVEYALSGKNAVGFWGCARDLGSQQAVTLGTAPAFNVASRAQTQANLFWHHKFDTGADSWLWVGVPDHGRLSADGSLGDWMVGASVIAPLSDRLALYANGSYFRPSAAAGAIASVESGYDVSMGVAWYFGGNAVSHKINGAKWLPYMPVANNSTFLVDQHPSYYP